MSSLPNPASTGAQVVALNRSPEASRLEPDWTLWPIQDALRLRVVVACERAPAESGTGVGTIADTSTVQAAAETWWALTTNPGDDLLRQAVSARVQLTAGQTLRWRAVDEDRLADWLAQGEHAYQARESLHDGQGAAADEGGVQELTIQSISGQTSPVVRLLDATLFDALKAQASDLHLESTPSGMVVRYRLDGVMERIGDVGSRETAEQLISRLKVVAELDIGERRLPQDGRFKRRVGQGGADGSGARDVDFRVSIMPSSYGEDAVIRILDRSKLAEDHTGLTLDRLGFEADDAAQVLKLAAKPYGMLLVTGPTGSGKTTTLYAVIAQTQDGRDKLITIEDPVEYQLPGVVQIPVNEKKGLTFARGLRSILRHDPDKIMVGEIRDSETAQIASQAALTGHLVLTTVHANNSFDVIGRFMHMGLDLYNVVSALNGVLAQRLMRRLCTHCAAPWQPQLSELKAAGIPLDAQGRYMRAVGCAHCRGTGYKGRRAIAEIMTMDDTLRDLIVSRQALTQIKAHARAAGTRLLRESAIACVLRGESTLEELNRVTLAE